MSILKGADGKIIPLPNPLHPANEVTVLDDAVEQMTELEFAEYERNLYQDRARSLSDKLKEVKAIVDGISDEIGWKSLLLKVIGNAVP